MKFTPRPYQTMITEHIIKNPRCAIWASMGLGKTTATLNAIDVLSLIDKAPTLVLAPLRVAKTTWGDEAKKWDHFHGLEVIQILGTLDQRKIAAKRRGEIFTTNYENIEWLVSYWGDAWPYRIVVADESTKLKGFRLRQGGKRARALSVMAHTQIDRFILLTGTPSPNGLIDLWGQMWFLDAGMRLGRTFSAFTDRWFTTKRNGFGLTALPHAQKEIEEKLKDLCLTIDGADFFDLDQPIVNNIYVQLPDSARKIYRDMEKEMFANLGEHTVEAFGAAARTIKCLQIANGAAYLDGDTNNYVELHSAKLEALESIIEEANGAPVLVAYHFKSDLERLLKAFPKAKILDTDPKTISNWNKGLISILFAHPASAGHGLNLQDGGNILVYFSHWWALEQRMQILERIGPVRQMQAGHKRPVYVHNIIAKGTVDELVIERTISKREVQDILLAAMKSKVK